MVVVQEIARRTASTMPESARNSGWLRKGEQQNGWSVRPWAIAEAALIAETARRALAP